MSAHGARCLRGLPAGNFMAVVPAGVAAGLREQGFALNGHARAYVHAGGRVTLRIVWRKRGAIDSVVMMLRLRGEMPPEVAETLMAALEPRVVGDAGD